MEIKISRDLSCGIDGNITHYLFDEYVISAIPNAFGVSQKKGYWISKKGYTAAYYCFSASSEAEVEYHLGCVDSYIAMYEARSKQ